ncbi:MAG: tetratricopeptide repeat protein [Azoarcus sp.]|jgi:tetratricopeptide (TPR) repeat protein|nr:tetratricopeptide repeat protein [Azoarcus sp.]
MEPLDKRSAAARLSLTVAMLAAALAMTACETLYPTAPKRRPTTTASKPQAPYPQPPAQQPPHTGVEVGKVTSPLDALPTAPDTTHPYGGASTANSAQVNAMFNQAANLGREGKLNDAIRIYQDIEQNYGNQNYGWGAWALFYQGELYRQLRNFKSAAAAYDRVNQRYGMERDAALRTIVADSLEKKGDALAELNDVKGAIAAYEETGRHFGNDSDAAMRLRALRSLFKEGMLLQRKGAGTEGEYSIPSANGLPVGDTAAAITVYDDIVARFGRESDPGIRNAIGGTLLQKSEALRLLGNNRETIVVYDDIVRRFERDSTVVSRKLVATALYRKGLAQSRQGDRMGAAASFDDVVARFASEPDTGIRKLVEMSVAAKRKLDGDSLTPQLETNEPPPLYDN